MANAVYKNADELFTALSSPSELQTLIETIGEIQIDKFDYNGFNLMAILQNILKCSATNKRTKLDLFTDLIDIVIIGLVRGNIRKDQLIKTVDDGRERIEKLVNIYQIPMRSDSKSKIDLKPGTLTFTRALSCFPHIASMLLVKSNQIVKNGNLISLNTKILPSGMKHSGFASLIPTQVATSLSQIFLLAHTAYMIDFGRLINPNDFVSVTQSYQKQMNFGQIAMNSSIYPDDVKIGYLRAIGLSTPAAFKAIVEVANNLLKEIGKKVLNYNDFELSFIKNNVVCYSGDEDKDKASEKEVKSLFDKLMTATNVSTYSPVSLPGPSSVPPQIDLS